MRAVIMMSEGIEKLVKNKKISQEEIQNILTRFGKNDWGELNEDDKEEQDRMLIEGFYIKNRNPKLDEIFTGVYIINHIFIWIKSKYDNYRKELIVKVKLPQE
ncbi:TPA: hypothetical protein ACF2DJ_002806 [Clostridium perfringens]